PIFFFFNDTPTTQIYTLSLHDALPIYPQLATRIDLYLNSSCSGTPDATGTVSDFTGAGIIVGVPTNATTSISARAADAAGNESRSEEHTSELQSRENLVCRLLLEKKKK